MSYGFRIPAGARNFSVVQNVWVTSSPVFTAQRGCFMDAKRPGREVDPHVVPGVRLGGSKPLLSLYALMVRTGTALCV
jgi:hypothetical protein